MGEIITKRGNLPLKKYHVEKIWSNSEKKFVFYWMDFEGICPKKDEIIIQNIIFEDNPKIKLGDNVIDVVLEMDEIEEIDFNGEKMIKFSGIARRTL